jgi:predicted alpha/beta superfamily hydrolase
VLKASLPRGLVLSACALSLLFAGAVARQPQGSRAATFPAVTIPNSEVRTMKSAATGRGYDIYVFFPDNYPEGAQKLPVVYALDGQWDFKLLASVYGGLFYDKFVPEMMVVGITYHGDSPDYNALRAMDYTPRPVPLQAGSGGAPKFLTFLKTELIPFVESNYRADPARRVLLGSSLGGLFTLYALLSEPRLFSGYVAASPAVPYADNFAFKQEADYAAKHKDLPARLFISVGDSELLTQPVKEFARAINGRGYEGLKIESRVIEGERHAGNKPEAFNRGLRFVFRTD